MNRTVTNYLLALIPVFCSVPLAQAQIPPLVVFDPGHGGTPGEPPPNDVGCLTPISGYYEKDVNLQVAAQVWAWMEINGYADGSAGSPQLCCG